MMKIAIASGKGGTGKTFVSVNLFRVLRKIGVKASLIDCDVEVPNVLTFIPSHLYAERKVSEYRPIINGEKCIFCNRCVEYCTYHAITCVPSLHFIRLLNDFCHGCGACTIACGTGAIKDSYKVVGKISTYEYQGEICLAEGRMAVGYYSHVPIIKSVLGDLFDKEYQFTLYDSPPGTSCPFIQTVNKADYVILVTEPTPFGLSDLKQAVNTLKKMNKPFGIVVNRAGIGNDDVYDYLKMNNFALLINIPFEERIAQLYSEGKIVVDFIPQVEKIFKELIRKVIINGNCNN